MITDFHQTIIAPVTPPGEGGVGIIRLSGLLAEPALLRFFCPSRRAATLTSHRLYHGHLRSESGELVDEVMAVVMRAPYSFTREDVAEIHCHGGPLVMQHILDLFLESGGVRLARPGEFTQRAFLNGRLDLTQAEAVIDVIRSRSDAARGVAMRQLEGRLSKAIHQIRNVLVDLLATVEAHVDFPDEDIELPDQQILTAGGNDVLSSIDRLLATFEDGRVLREGLSVLILGRPNVGKSSLLNALLGEARAIVTDVPGTTRDTIEESFSLCGLPLRLVDTAGIRNTVDPVEAEGVRRARQKVGSADLVLLVIDGSVRTGEDDLLALEACSDSRLLLVVNKSDLLSAPLSKPFTTLPLVRVSTHTGEGLTGLTQRMAALFTAPASAEGRESILLSDRRHRDALLRSRQHLVRFCEEAPLATSPELLAIDLRDALQALGEITGETTPDEILERIFSRFCVGK
jgi:tRNA modification GTPase